MTTTNPTSDEAQREFDSIFYLLTDIDPDDSKINGDCYLFVPPTVDLSNRPRNLRMRISNLSGPNGWQNHLVNDEYAGWWIKRPS